MDLEQRINALSLLGRHMRENPIPEHLVHAQLRVNPFFSAREINRASLNWSSLLQEPLLQQWTARYNLNQSRPGKEILVSAAGNIPMAGFHDFLCVLIAGFRFIGRLSSRDNLLLPHLAEKLVEIEPGFNSLIGFNPPTNPNPVALIASGSTNTARYYLQDFGYLPSIIRKTRVSPAVIDGTETDRQLFGLAGDILHYYGLGCRSVSSIMVPEGYNPSKLAGIIREYPDLEQNPALQNNLRYQKARLKLMELPFIDAGPVLLVQHPTLHSAIATVNMLEYNTIETLNYFLTSHAEAIQCVVGNAPPPFNPVPFGTVQQPALWDYADGADTLAFLNSLTTA
jgi:hypothetical protein